MSDILVNKSGKGGPSCSWSADSELGCANACITCYGNFSSRRGPDQYKNNILEKEYNHEKFIKSIDADRKKGMGVFRTGKHSDPYSIFSTGKTIRILEAATERGVRSVSISKSIVRSVDIADLYKGTGHVLHISAGMLCSIKNETRIANYRWYASKGANVKLRITDDVTSEMPMHYKGFNNDRVIITPIRFKSKKDAAIYNVDLDNYEYNKGYYRPKFIHSSWLVYTNYCGDVNGNSMCCNCLIDKD